MHRSEVTNCAIGMIGGIVCGLSIAAITWNPGAGAIVGLVLVFLGYFLGAILDGLEDLNIQIKHLRRGA